MGDQRKLYQISNTKLHIGQ